jgi:hypothetical protein
MAKNSQQNASPTPTATQTWTMRQQQQPPESYQYSQLSPSRSSPSAPTYTQLSSGLNTRTAYNAAATQQPGKMKIEIFLNDLKLIFL